jgi:hypothetical protein
MTLEALSSKAKKAGKETEFESRIPTYTALLRGCMGWLLPISLGALRVVSTSNAIRCSLLITGSLRFLVLA